MTAPWVICVITVIWFAWIGVRLGQNVLFWALQGGLFALPISTMIIGVCNASFSPVTYEAQKSHHVKSIILAILPILILGGIMEYVVWRRRSKEGDAVARL